MKTELKVLHGTRVSDKDLVEIEEYSRLAEGKTVDELYDILDSKRRSCGNWDNYYVAFRPFLPTPIRSDLMYHIVDSVYGFSGSADYEYDLGAGLERRHIRKIGTKIRGFFGDLYVKELKYFDDLSWLGGSTLAHAIANSGTIYASFEEVMKILVDRNAPIEKHINQVFDQCARNGSVDEIQGLFDLGYTYTGESLERLNDIASLGELKRAIFFGSYEGENVEDLETERDELYTKIKTNNYEQR